MMESEYTDELGSNRVGGGGAMVAVSILSMGAMVAVWAWRSGRPTDDPFAGPVEKAEES
jgi:hypothetical protein